MNLPSDYLAKISHGKNADQTAEDGRLLIPPAIIPSFDIPRPATCDSVGSIQNVVINDSIVGNTGYSRTNAIAADLTAFYLLAGLWELEMSFDIYWDYALAAFTRVRLDVMDQSGARAVLVAVVSTGVAAVHHLDITRRIHIKPRPDLSVVQGDVWTFFMTAPAAGPAQTVFFDLNVNFRRFL